MLPVIVYEPDEATRETLLSVLELCARQRSEGIRLLVQTGSAQQASQFLQHEKGVLLLVAHVDALERDEQKAGIRLGQRAMKQNRDSYTLFCLREPGDLAALINLCARPAGVLTLPIALRDASLVFRRILADYADMVKIDDGAQLILQTGGSIYRMPSHQVLYIEARDKKVLIWTTHQCITVYERLGALAEQLGDRFVQCHRSYLVNCSAIERVDFAEMQVYLKGGVALPLSRSCRDALKRSMDSGEKVTYAN